MEIWVLIVIITLIVGIAIISVATYSVQTKNDEMQSSNILYPFKASAKPGESSISLLNSTGDPQIRCPAGSSVNIVGAWAEVMDPYGQCSPQSSNLLNASCGIPTKTPISCTTNTACGDGMTCEGGICVPSKCPIKVVNGVKIPDPETCACGGSRCPVQPGEPCTTSLDCGDPNVMECVPIPSMPGSKNMQRRKCMA